MGGDVAGGGVRVHKTLFPRRSFLYVSPMIELTNAQIRELKAQAQRMKATLKIGKDGVTPAFLKALDNALNHHELLKVKFDDLKDQKKELAPQVAEKTGSHLVTRVGNVIVLYRPKPPEEASEPTVQPLPANPVSERSKSRYNP